MRSKWKVNGIFVIFLILLFSVPFMSNAEQSIGKTQVPNQENTELDGCEEGENRENTDDVELEESDCKETEEHSELDDESNESDDTAEPENESTDEEESTDTYDEEQGSTDSPDDEEERQDSLENHSVEEPIDERKESGKDEEEQSTDAKEVTKETEKNEEDRTSEQQDLENQEESKQPSETPGLIDVGLLERTTLEAEHTILTDGTQQITLTYTGHGLLNLGLLSNTYSIFHLPSEIRDAISKEKLSATYDVPALGLLGIEIRNRGDFRDRDITLEGNQVSMNFFNLLSLNLFNDTHYTFTLTIDLEELPPTRTGKYVFYAGATSQLVDLSILSDDTVARAELVAPQLPTSPVINAPVFTTDNIVTGTAEANTTVILLIGEEEYTGQVNEQGDFSVNIPPQQAGTEIRGVVMNEQGYESDETVVIVVEPPDMTPPDAPLVDPVYSNETVVTGSGEPNTTVRLTINDTSYADTVDENGNYAVNIPAQDPGTVISAVLVDDAGNESTATVVTVTEATIAFHRVPESLSFTPTVITPGVARIPRQDPDWFLEVIDTRGPGNKFRVMAEAEEPLKNADGHTLSDALVFVDENSNSHPLTAGPIEVYDGMTEDGQITQINWDRDKGPFIEVDTGNVYAGTYSTTVTWTLVDAP